MSQYRPSVIDLLATVKDYIDAVGPMLNGELRYHGQVCSFVLSVCQRELAAGNTSDEQDRTAWRGLLGDFRGDPADLTRELCKNIRSGQLDDRFDEVLDTVLARTIGDVEIVRPDQILPHDHFADR